MSDLPWIRFVALRWFNSGRESGPSLKPAMAGIAVGVAAMIIIIGVMNGFQMGFMDSVLELDSYHLRVDYSAQNQLDALAKDRYPGVRTVLPFLDIRTMVLNEKGRAEALRLKVLPDDALQRDPKLTQMLRVRSGGFGPGLLIGSELAQRLEVGIDDTLSVVSVLLDPDEGVSASTEPMRVAGIFQSGFYDFDAGLAFLPVSQSGTLAKGEIWRIGIKLVDRFDDARTLALLQADGLSETQIQSWRSYNRAFFGALRMEKSMMMLLVGLIFLVVGVNIFHSLRKAVFARIEDIATLKALGSGSASLRRIFMLDGVIAGIGGAVLGLLVGLFIALNVNQVFAVLENLIALVADLLPGKYRSFSFFSPDFFYISDVPVRLLFTEVFFIFMAGASSAVIAALAASRRISSLKPSEVLRDE